MSVRDFSTATFATSQRPTAAPLGGAILSEQLTRNFSTTTSFAARRAWLPYMLHKQRKSDSTTSSTEQSGPTQDKPTSVSPPHSPLKSEQAADLKAILGNLKIPVWKRATIRKVKHHFDDVQRGGQKDPEFLVRWMKTEMPVSASGSPEPRAKRRPEKKMVMYRPGGSVEAKSEGEGLDGRGLSPSPESFSRRSQA